MKFRCPRCKSKLKLPLDTSFCPHCKYKLGEAYKGTKGDIPHRHRYGGYVR